MLHERILVLVKYVTEVLAGTDPLLWISFQSDLTRLAGQARPDQAILRSLAALVASLPASENKHFREEFDTVST